MKKLTLITFSIFSFVIVYSQELSTKPYIKVEGMATLEIIPDEIEIGFTAQEYKNKNENILLPTIHNQLLKIINELQIPTEHLQVIDFYGSRWMHKRRVKDLVANKRYSLKLKQLNLADKLIQKLDSINIQEIELISIGHSEIEKFEQNVKIQATKNAKEKALLMTAALNQKLGNAFEMIELTSNTSISNASIYADKYAEGLDYVNSNKLNKVSFRTISLDYSVSIKFELPQL